MIRGIYTSASSLLTLLRQQEALSHNLANVNTPGFKQELVIPEEATTQTLIQDVGLTLSPEEVGLLPSGVDGSYTLIDYRPGPLENTQRPLDLAITGDGFFRVQTPDGIRLTRDGSFQRDSANHLVTSDGYLLLGENGPIEITEDAPYIAEDGNVYLSGAGEPSARITLARVADLEALRPLSDNLLDPGAAEMELMPAAETAIRQRFLEQANVDVTGTMVSMMAALRSYEATQRTLQLQDQTLQQTLSVGRVS